MIFLLFIEIIAAYHDIPLFLSSDKDGIFMALDAKANIELALEAETDTQLTVKLDGNHIQQDGPLSWGRTFLQALFITRGQFFSHIKINVPAQMLSRNQYRVTLHSLIKELRKGGFIEKGVCSFYINELRKQYRVQFGGRQKMLQYRKGGRFQLKGQNSISVDRLQVSIGQSKTILGQQVKLKLNYSLDHIQLTKHMFGRFQSALDCQQNQEGYLKCPEESPNSLNQKSLEFGAASLPLYLFLRKQEEGSLFFNIKSGQQNVLGFHFFKQYYVTMDYQRKELQYGPSAIYPTASRWVIYLIRLVALNVLSLIVLAVMQACGLLRKRKGKAAQDQAWMQLSEHTL